MFYAIMLIFASACLCCAVKYNTPTTIWDEWHSKESVNRTNPLRDIVMFILPVFICVSSNNNGLLISIKRTNNSANGWICSTILIKYFYVVFGIETATENYDNEKNTEIDNQDCKFQWLACRTKVIVV